MRCGEGGRRLLRRPGTVAGRKARIVLEVGMLGRGVAMEIDAGLLEPADDARRRPRQPRAVHRAGRVSGAGGSRTTGQRACGCGVRGKTGEVGGGKGIGE